MIQLTCGHEEPTRPTGWEIFYKDYDEVGAEVLVVANYCANCLVRQLKEAPDDTWLTFEEAWDAVFGEPNGR